MPPMALVFALPAVLYLLGIYLFLAVIWPAVPRPTWIAFLWPLVVIVALVAGGREGLVRTVDAWRPR